ncbi:MAG: hypothetical protein GY820_03850 [Gammaproteobacteria bacterium]|nr:hypothetical protein [Gammaproteobacteria bacterium]
MNSFDDWSQIISKYLKSESDPLGSLAKHGFEGDAARTAFIRSVLDRFLPETYGVGTGQVVDSKGNMSGKIDIIVYRRDFPRLDLPGSRDIYLYESVIATFEITAKLVKKTFYEALDSCALLAELNPDIDDKVMTSLATRNQLTLNDNRQYVHPDPLRTARFHLIGRPLSFVYAFSGYKTSSNMMIETLGAWMRERKENHKPVYMKSLPAVVATQGCFAWRNSVPYTVNENYLLGVGKDDAPVRLIILQMLHSLSRKLRITADSFGLKPSLDGYLSRMPPPQIDQYIGKALNPVVGDTLTLEKSSKQNTVPKKRVTPAVAKQPPKPVTSTPVKPVPSTPVKPVPSKVAEKSAVEITVRTPLTSPPPASELKAEKPAEAPKTLATLDPKPEAVDAPFPQLNADLIPDLDPDPPDFDKVETKTPVPTSLTLDAKPSIPKRPAAVKNNAVVKPKKPANTSITRSVDIELHAETPKVKPESVKAVDSAQLFMETVKMPASNADVQPCAKPVTNESSSSATSEFVETVTMKVAAPEPFPDMQSKSEHKPDPFTSTIPQ